MTLPKRLISLLLIYCFALYISAGIRPPVVAGNSSQTQSPTEVGTLAPLDHVYDFLSSLLSLRQANSADDEDSNKEAKGLKFRLSEAAEQPEAKPISKVASATVLSDAETQAILN